MFLVVQVDSSRLKEEACLSQTVIRKSDEPLPGGEEDIGVDPSEAKGAVTTLLSEEANQQTNLSCKSKFITHTDFVAATNAPKTYLVLHNSNKPVNVVSPTPRLRHSSMKDNAPRGSSSTAPPYSEWPMQSQSPRARESISPWSYSIDLGSSLTKAVSSVETTEDRRNTGSADSSRQRESWASIVKHGGKNQKNEMKSTILQRSIQTDIFTTSSKQEETLNRMRGHWNVENCKSMRKFAGNRSNVFSKSNAQIKSRCLAKTDDVIIKSRESIQPSKMAHPQNDPLFRSKKPMTEFDVRKQSSFPKLNNIPETFDVKDKSKKIVSNLGRTLGKRYLSCSVPFGEVKEGAQPNTSSRFTLNESAKSVNAQNHLSQTSQGRSKGEMTREAFTPKKDDKTSSSTMKSNIGATKIGRLDYVETGRAAKKSAQQKTGEHFISFRHSKLSKHSANMAHLTLMTENRFKQLSLSEDSSGTKHPGVHGSVRSSKTNETGALGEHGNRPKSEIKFQAREKELKQTPANSRGYVLKERSSNGRREPKSVTTASLPQHHKPEDVMKKLPSKMLDRGKAKKKKLKGKTMVASLSSPATQDSANQFLSRSCMCIFLYMLILIATTLLLTLHGMHRK